MNTQKVLWAVYIGLLLMAIIGFVVTQQNISNSPEDTWEDFSKSIPPKEIQKPDEDMIEEILLEVLPELPSTWGMRDASPQEALQKKVEYTPPQEGEQIKNIPEVTAPEWQQQETPQAELPQVETPVPEVIPEEIPMQIPENVPAEQGAGIPQDIDINTIKNIRDNASEEDRDMIQSMSMEERKAYFQEIFWGDLPFWQ